MTTTFATKMIGFCLTVLLVGAPLKSAFAQNGPKFSGQMSASVRVLKTEVQLSANGDYKPIGESKEILKAKVACVLSQDPAPGNNNCGVESRFGLGQSNAYAVVHVFANVLTHSGNNRLLVSVTSYGLLDEQDLFGMPRASTEIPFPKDAVSIGSKTPFFQLADGKDYYLQINVTDLKITAK